MRNKIVLRNHNNCGTFIIFLVHRSDRYATERTKISLKIKYNS